jgi:hypothetical protein
MPKVIQFHEFCDNVLKLKLEPGQRVIAKVAFGNYDPCDLEGEEKELALTLFGGVERVPPSVKKYVLMRLGRGSGKTTLCSAFAVYTCLTFDCSKAGPGSVPYAMIIAPDKATAKISVRMCRELIRGVPAIERLVVKDQDQVIQLRRPDGRMVQIECFAAQTKGSNVRSRDVMVFIFDEAEFFTSNGGEQAEREYAVNDKEIFNSITPRLMQGGRGLLISTPWPVETLMGTWFEEQWAKCTNCVCIKAPTNVVRILTPHLQDIIDTELARDADNARREFFCELDGITSGDFFDVEVLKKQLDPSYTEFPGYNPKWPVAIGCDLGFTRDSSAIAVVQYDGKNYRTVYLEELKPKPGKPLKPGDVIEHFAKIAHEYGGGGVVADAYYREALKEHLQKHGLVVYHAPEGVRGKADTYHRTRAVVHQGLHTMPDLPIARRMVQQAKLIVSKSSAGGTTTIKVPRKVGMGHGDLVSAWCLAVHKLAYARINVPRPVIEPGEDWNKESLRRITAAQEKLQNDYLKRIEKEVKKTMSRSIYRRVFEDRY